MAAKKSLSQKAEKAPEDEELIKVSYYIRVDQDTKLEEIKLIVRRTTGERTDKSALIREAIDLLAAKHKVK